jgi:hypothetical protein
MTLDYHDQIRFGYVEPDDDDYLPMCPECGHEFPTHEPSYADGDPEWPDLFWTCPVCQKDYSAEEVYP